jgi:hypothetical protein
MIMDSYARILSSNYIASMTKDSWQTGLLKGNALYASMSMHEETNARIAGIY